MKQHTNDPRLILKATAPKASRSLLYRERLGLNSGNQSDCFMIALQAAVGYGKTSLLLQWRREALEAGAIVAWLTLDEHDDAASLVRGLDVALSIGSGSGKFVPGEGSAAVRPEGELEALTVWLAEVASMAVDVVLMLDDAHTIPEATARTLLMYLLLNAPANLRIILAYRRALPMNFAELIASGRLVHLHADDLCFTLEETARVLEASPAQGVDKDSCVRLYELTEGWPLGVQLAMSSVMKRSNLHEAIAEFSSRSGDLQHYFMEVLVNRLAVEEVMFLVDISCLDRVHSELCQWLTENENSAAMLAHLRDATPIFQDVVSGDWVKIHPIAREFLSERFERLPVEHRQGLHARAAHWLAEHELFEEAAQHARLAGDEVFAFDLIERCLYGIMTQGRVSRVLEWLEHLPEDEIRRRPQLCIATGWALAQGERHADAAALVAPILEDPTAEPARRCEAAEICATAAFFNDDFDSLRDHISPWRDSLQEQPAHQQIVGTNLLAVLELFQGKPENANHHLQRLRKIARSAELSYAQGWSGWVSGFTYLWEGQVHLAEDVLRPALSRAEAESGRRSPIAVILAATLAAVLWQRQLFDEASLLLADRLDVLERHAPPDAIIHGYLTAARLAGEAGAQSKAHDLIEQLRAIGDSRGLPRLCIASLGEEIRMLALRHQDKSCQARLAALQRLEAEQASAWGILQPLVAPQIGVARVYAAIVSYHWDSVLPELDAIDPQIKQMRRVGDAIQVQLLKALAVEHRGEECAGMIAEVVSLAETLGLGRILADTYPTFAGMGSAEKKGVEATSAGDNVDSRSPRDQGGKRVREPPRVMANALLTPKETEVLQLLAGNLSNKKIALALGVGDQTIKWHLKNMFNKLQAGTRQHLIARARMLGILE
jgi:LuxR family transcriptional regulator, maltose regulon positive regulatory protein